MAITPVQSIHSLGQRTGLAGKVHQKVLKERRPQVQQGVILDMSPAFFIGITAL